MHDVIFKYVLRLDQDTTIALPHGAVPVHVADQDGLPCLWIRHAAPPEGGPKWDRTFRIVGTGQKLPSQALHIGTFLSGPFVWHVIEPRGT